MTRKMLCLARLQSWFLTFLLGRERKERREGGREALPVQTPQTSPQPRKNKPDFRGCPLPLAPAQGCKDNPCFAAGMEDSLSLCFVYMMTDQSGGNQNAETHYYLCHLRDEAETQGKQTACPKSLTPTDQGWEWKSAACLRRSI